MPMPGNPLHGALANDVLDKKGEGRELDRGRSLQRRPLKVNGLAGPMASCATFYQPSDALRIDRAVGIYDQYYVRWIQLQVLLREIQCEALSTSQRIHSLDHFDANLSCDFSC